MGEDAPNFTYVMIVLWEKKEVIPQVKPDLSQEDLHLHENPNFLGDFPPHVFSGKKVLINDSSHHADEKSLHFIQS